MKVNNACEGKKAEIINTATRLFAANGYYGTTLDDIAKQLGITKAALYYYIKGKGDIIREIGQKNLIRMEQSIKISKSELPPKEKLSKLIKSHVIFSAESAEEASILFEQANVLPKRTRAAINRKKKEVEQALQRTLEEGREQGCFTVEDVKITSFAILGLCNWTYHWYRPDGELTTDQIANKFIDFVERGLSASETTFHSMQQ